MRRILSIGAGAYASGSGTSNTIPKGNGAGQFSDSSVSDNGTVVSTAEPINSTAGFRVATAAASGNYLRGDGTNFVSSAILAADQPNIASTAAQGGFVPPYVFSYGFIATGAGGVLTANNQIRCAQFVLPYKTTISQVSFQVTTGGGVGKLLNLGIYDAPGTTLITNTGAIDANSAAVRTAALSGGAVILNPAVYWFAYTSDSSTTAFQKILADTQSAAIIGNVSGRIGTAANSSTAGVFPGSLGAITAAAVNVPFAFFER